MCGRLGMLLQGMARAPAAETLLDGSSLDSLDDSLPLLLELDDDEEDLESLPLSPRERLSFTACFRARSRLNLSRSRSSFSFKIWEIQVDKKERNFKMLYLYLFFLGA